MKKVLLFVHFILIAVTTMHAQSLNEDFESAQFPPEGWTTRCIDYPSLKNFPSWSQVEPNDPYLTGYKGGKAACSQSSGFGKSAAWTSSWLITPQITIGENDYLSFMFGANASFNGLATTKDPYKLTVMVSTTATDSICFTDTIFQIAPKNVLSWGSYSIDMKKYAGKKVYVAFWNFGHTQGTTGAFMANKMYLDHVRITQTSSPDVALSSISGVVNGCQLEQTLKTTVKNTGSVASSYKLCYQIDNNSVVKENINEALESGKEKEYVFGEKVKFTEPRQNMDSVYNIKVWVEAPNDANLYNDTLATAVTIVGSMEYPFKVSGEDGQKFFRSSTASGKLNAYWKWFGVDDGGENNWLFSPYRGKTSILASNCIVLPVGEVRIKFEYKCPINFKVTASLGNFDYSDYKSIGTSDEIPASAYEWAKGGLTVNVKDLGKYSLGLTVNATSQLQMRNIEICDPYNDVAVKAITAPYANAMMKNNAVTVTAVFKNIGKDDLQNVPVHYQAKDGKVVDGVIASLPRGEEVSYTFDTKADFSQLGANELKVWSTLQSDGDSSNDEATTTVEVYEAAGFPYKMGFEPDENWKNWITYNPEKDIVYWEVMQVVNGNINYAKEGQYAAYINSLSGVTHDDWLISPAVTLPKGKVRLSFYYTTLYATGTSNLKVYFGKTDYYADFKNGTPSATFAVTNTKFYRQGYVLLDVEEAGNYYLAFYNDGSGRDIILDDVRLDEADDMAIESIDAPAQNGFYLTDTEVTVSFVNHGAKAKANVPLSYTVYRDGTESSNVSQTVTETYSGSIEPGASVQYTFTKKADISTPGTYLICGEVKDASDSDDYNNKIFSSPAIVHYKAATIPYVGDLETDLERAQWTFTGGWATGGTFNSANSAYSGTGAIRHSGAALSKDGDWAFSGCIEIPAGTYDLGFFYRTFLITSGNPTPEKNGQNFEVFLGSAPAADAMSMSVYKAENTLVPGRQYQKVVNTITIPQDGRYYIGVKCTTTNTMSSALFMDYFTIKAPVTTGLSLETEPYVADFANRESEWYHYNPSGHFEQWTVATAGDETFMKAKVNRDDAGTGLTYAPCPGAYVAPVMSLKKGDIIKATFDYSIIIKASAPESSEQYIRLYMADKDMPDAFTTLVASGDDNSGDRATASGSITIPADGLYYFGYLIETPVSTQAFNLYSTKIEKIGTDPSVGIQNAETEESGYYVAGHTLYLTGDYQSVRIYNGNGQLVLHTGSTDRIELDTYESGMYILSLTSGSVTKTGKFIVK